MPETTDLTFRHDRTGNMVIGKRGEYVVNIVQMLFNMKPGTDEFDSDKGLYISSKYFTHYTNNTRDSEYESKIVQQFTTYTDLIPSNVIAMYIDNTLRIYMMIRYEGNIYEMDMVFKNDTLTAMLRNS